MMRTRRVAIAAAGLAVAAGGGVAIAATTGSTPKEREQAVLDDAAGRLGTTADKLRDALGAAEDAQLDAAVKAGEITQDQADAIKARRAQSGLVLGDEGGHGFDHGFGFRHDAGATDAALDAAAKTLKLDRDQLLTRLRDGTSLADIAKAQNVSIDDVRAAAQAAAKAELDKAVSAGDLTQAQADEELTEIVDRIEQLRGGFFFGPGRGPGPGGPGFRFRSKGGVLGAAAKALKLSEAQLFNRLRNGQTLQQIADAQGVSLADVRAAARAKAKQELDQEVSAGHLTQAQADALLQRIVDGIDHFPADRPFGRHP
jgi:uncharacterized protein (DUF433 family)